MRATITLIAGIIAFLAVAGNPCSASLGKKTGIPQNLITPPESETDTSITLLWNSPEIGQKPLLYAVYQDGRLVATVDKTNYTVTGLVPGKSYSFCIKAKDDKGKLSKSGNTIVKSTKKTGQVFNVLSFGAKGDGTTKNTKAIQDAINACTPGGTVYIPAGTFLSGALFLKSNMTFYIAEGGVLKGSTDIQDYSPMIPNRFEGWELNSFASLLTAGKIDHNDGYGITNLTIRGKGTISGGGQVLGQAMTDAGGGRARGRLICLMNCKDVNIQGLIIEESPCWTIHYIYSKNITCHDLAISSTVGNGDGMDPDSSVDSYIFNCTFSTNDDCIAIKSGKNPEGYYIAKPTENVFISSCRFIEGHSLAIGSEMSGGVRNVVVSDCDFGNMILGMQVKVTKDRGGFVEGLKVRDCKLKMITIKTAIGYNNNGEPAPKLPYLKDMEFSGLDMTESNIKKTTISVEGFAGVKNYTRSLFFKDIKLPEKATVMLSNCKDVSFQNVLTVSGEKPVFKVTDSENINF